MQNDYQIFIHLTPSHTQISLFFTSSLELLNSHVYTLFIRCSKQFPFPIVI